ncbi:MAG: hypothetical protein ACIAS6_14550 [Phycisphaerales bacterium JB060]
MSTIPTQPEQSIDWVQAHIGPWTTNAETLKLDPLVIGELSALASAAADARTAKINAKNAYRNSVTTFDAAVKSMRTLAGGQVSIIRSTAKNAENPEAIYTAAVVPAPADRTAAPAPGTPTGFKHTLSIGGELTVRFACPNPPRVGPVTYRVDRRVGGTGQPFIPFVTLKERELTDTGIPLGTPEVAYRITPQTSTKDGGLAQFAIQFGAGNQATLVEQVPDGVGVGAGEVKKAS